MTIIEDACRQFSTRRFPLPSRSQVDQLEQSIGVTFPEDYRQYILDYNGGYFIEPWITPVVDDCVQSAIAQDFRTLADLL